MFLTGNRFTGVKMIPPGPHIVTTTIVSHDKLVPTVARWLFVQPQSIHVWQWNADSCRFEELDDLDQVRSSATTSQTSMQDAACSMQARHEQSHTCLKPVCWQRNQDKEVRQTAGGAAQAGRTTA